MIFQGGTHEEYRLANQFNQSGSASEEDPSGIRVMFFTVIELVVTGEMDLKKANTIITDGNAVLNAIRTNGQDMKIQETAAS